MTVPSSISTLSLLCVMFGHQPGGLLTPFASGIGGVYFTLPNFSVCAKAVCMMHKHKIGVRNEAKSNFEHFIICFPCSKPHSATLLMDSS